MRPARDTALTVSSAGPDFKWIVDPPSIPQGAITPMINRGTILLRYREPMIRWINDADPYDEDPDITREDVQCDRTGYLVADEDSDGKDAVERWVEANVEVLFESELKGWYTDPKLWPKPRDLESFQEWFDVEYHSVIIDTVRGEIQNEEF